MKLQPHQIKLILDLIKEKIDILKNKREEVIVETKQRYNYLCQENISDRKRIKLDNEKEKELKSQKIKFRRAIKKLKDLYNTCSSPQKKS